MKMAQSVKDLAENMAHTNAVARGREHSVRGYLGGPPRDADDFDDTLVKSRELSTDGSNPSTSARGCKNRRRCMASRRPRQRKA